MKQRTFITYLLLFFIPVLLGYGVMEYLSRGLALSYVPISEYLEQDAGEIEVLVLGSSQMKGGINPQFLDAKTLNLAAGNQHHDSDFKLLKQMVSRLPNLHTVVLEVSYGHFELPHNGRDFWKNSIYLKYYGVNAFERPTYFKDQLLYLSNPTFYSEQILHGFHTAEKSYGYNRFGYDTLNFDGVFKDLAYNEEKISALKTFKINKTPNSKIFKKNSQLFMDMLKFTEAENLNVILCQAPMYKTYLPQRVPEILGRRDSVVKAALRQYSHVRLLALETDTVNYTVKDYWNQSHLNPRGAAKFSERLNAMLLRNNAD